ncbi:hypothetical protein ACFL3Q_03740 [Planctomycetota bacterium]
MSVKFVDIRSVLYSHFSSAYSDVALIYATCLDERFRDGPEAVKMAKKACELSAYKNHYHVATLAAAYAECGDFENAIEWQKKAVELEGNDIFKTEYEKRLAAYRAKKPWRQ